MSVYPKIIQHIERTIKALPAGTISAFPHIAAAGFTSIDSAGGARLDLEECVGQSRVFEIDLEDTESTPLEYGGVVPAAYEDEVPVRIRYEGSGPHRKLDVLTQIKEDQLAICDGLHRSNWSSISGFVSLYARPGNILSFSLSDEAENIYEGYTSEIAVSISFNTTQ